MSGIAQDRGVGAIPGQESPPVVIVRPLRNGQFAVKRIQFEAKGSGAVVSSPRIDGFGLVVFLADHAAFDLFTEGRTIRAAPTQTGQSRFHNLNLDVAAHFLRPIDVLYLYIPRASLDAVADECGVSRIGTLRTPPGAGASDAVVRDLCFSLLPSVERLDQANRLFMDHIGTALLVHLAHAHGGGPGAPQPERVRLAPWQRRRAEDMIIARLDGEIVLEELACEFDLRASDFARAFRKSTGRAPYRWLIEQRVEKAKDLLLNSNHPVEEIAVLSGFVDQSHFTRVFSRATGAAPGAWRRQRRG